MTPKMQEALVKLAESSNLPKSAFHHSTVTALLKGGHVEEVPGNQTWITLPVAADAEEEAATEIDGFAAFHAAISGFSGPVSEADALVMWRQMGDDTAELERLLAPPVAFVARNGKRKPSKRRVR